MATDEHDEPDEPREDPPTGEGPPAFDLCALGDALTDRARYNAEWRRVFRYYDPRLRAYFGSQGLGKDALDDLTAEIWMAAYRHIRTVRSVDALWGWLRKIGVNSKRFAGRTATRRVLREKARGDGVTGDAPEDALDRLVRREPAMRGLDARVLREGLERLPAIEQKYVQLYVIEEMSHARAAEACNWSQDIGEKRWQRIRDRLRGRS